MSFRLNQVVTASRRSAVVARGWLWVVCAPLLVASSAGLAAAAEATPVVMFTSGDIVLDPEDPDDEKKPRLLADGQLREIGRQMILMVAREDFGLATRDEALLEPVDRDSPNTFELSVECWSTNEMKIRVSRGGKELYSDTSKYRNVTSFEMNFIWTRKVFKKRNDIIKMFEEAGFERRDSEPLLPDVSRPLPEEIEQQLLTMHHLSQYRAVRSLHRLIQEEGETVERLGGLARGYANLCQLTISTPGARAEVFGARALMYAQRMSVIGPRMPLKMWNKAYVATLIGFPTHALNQLKQAEKELAKAPVRAPDWLELVEDYCHYRFINLASYAIDEESPLRQLAALFWFRAAQQSHSGSLITRTGGEVMAVAPHCLWVVDVLTWRAGVGYGHQITAHAPRAHAAQLASYLPVYEELPERVRSMADEGPEELGWNERAELANALVDAGESDRLEPSFAVLGRNIEAFNVLQAMRRAYFVKKSLGASASDEVAAIEQAIANHPEAPLVRSLGIRPGASPAEYAEVLKDYHFKEGNWYSSYWVLRSLPKSCQFANMTAGEARSISWYCGMWNEQRYIYTIRTASGKTAVQYADWMESCSRNAPIRFATYLRHDWEGRRDEVEQWLMDYGQNPAVVLAAAEGFFKEGDKARGVELFEQYLEESPDAGVFEKLANLYFQQGDDEQWLATMQRIFEHEDQGLTHASAAGRIADTLMHRGEFEEALPYAMRAANSGAGWAYVSAVECLTATGDFDSAERLAYTNNLRYGMNYAHDDWYNWCAENDRGHFDKAWEMKLERLKRNYPEGDREHQSADTLHLLVTGEKEQARDQLLKRLEKKFSPWDTMVLAMLYDEAGMAEKRDRALQTLIDHDPGDEPRPGFCVIAPVVLDFAKTGELDEEGLTLACQSITEGDPLNWEASASYFLGEMYAHRGDDAKAIERWKRPARFMRPSWERILAWRSLSDAGVDPVHIEGRYFARQFWRDAE